MYKSLLIFAVTILLCVSVHAQKQNIESLEPKAFKQQLDKHPDHVLLDVRTPGEVQEGVIPGATVVDFNTPDFTEKINALDKTKDYYVYCKAGGRSARTVDLMKKSGFTNVHDLKGGYSEWQKQGLPTTKPK